MTNLKVDGITYDVFIEYESLKRSIEITEGESTATSLTGKKYRDILSVGHNYKLTVVQNPNNPDAYNDLYEVLSSPVSIHTFELPYNDKVINFDAYIESGSDTYQGSYNGHNIWSGLELDLKSYKPNYIRIYVYGTPIEITLTASPPTPTIIPITLVSGSSTINSPAMTGTVYPGPPTYTYIGYTSDFIVPLTDLRSYLIAFMEYNSPIDITGEINIKREFVMYMDKIEKITFGNVSDADSYLKCLMLTEQYFQVLFSVMVETHLPEYIESSIDISQTNIQEIEMIEPEWLEINSVLSQNFFILPETIIPTMLAISNEITTQTEASIEFIWDQFLELIFVINFSESEINLSKNYGRHLEVNNLIDIQVPFLVESKETSIMLSETPTIFTYSASLTTRQQRLPAGYTELEYITCNGNSYFTTLIQPNVTQYRIRAVVKDECAVFDTVRPLWHSGPWDSSTNSMIEFSHRHNSSYKYTFFHGPNGRQLITYLSTPSDGMMTVYIAVPTSSSGSGTAKIWNSSGDTIYTSTNLYYTNKATGANLLLFAYPSANTGWIGRIYSFHYYCYDIYNNPQLDLVPAIKDSTQEVGMYDIYNDHFYVSEADPFVAGPEV